MSWDIFSQETVLKVAPQCHLEAAFFLKGAGWGLIRGSGSLQESPLAADSAALWLPCHRRLPACLTLKPEGSVGSLLLLLLLLLLLVLLLLPLPAGGLKCL